jgi:hypothetical protein
MPRNMHLQDKSIQMSTLTRSRDSCMRPNFKWETAAVFQFPSSFQLRPAFGRLSAARSIAFKVLFRASQASDVSSIPIAQREQKLRYDVERDLKNNQIKAGLDVLASHRRNEFPPQWSPPPWPEYGEGDKNPSLTEIVKALETRNDVPEWYTRPTKRS